MLFKYKATNQNGKTEVNILDAPNEDSLVSILQQKGLIVLSVSPVEEKGKAGMTFKPKLHSRITSKDIILFTTQLASTLKANIPLLKCVEIQMQQTGSRKFKAVLENIRENIKQGNSLKDSLSKFPKIFGPMWLNLIETGEASGQLAPILEHLAAYLVARADLRRKTITALIYPSILVAVSILAIYIFTIKIIPIFVNIFKDFKMELPLLTKVIVNISNFLSDNVLLTVLTVVGISYGFLRYIKTERGKRWFDAFIFKIPIFGPFLLSGAIEKFSSSLSILIHSGIPILQALDIVSRTAGNRTIEDILKNAYTEVRDGKPLSGALMKSQLMPPLVISMCSVGEETGELDRMLNNVVTHYRSEINTFVERLSATLEPVVIVFMGGIVFILVLAMYLPIFQIALLGGGRK
jgi:type IV pilus assembly protein PilC